MQDELYSDGEEKFGFLASKLYGLNRLIPTFKHYYKFVLEDLESFGKLNLMDIGCGNGYILLALGSRNLKVSAIGIDPSPQMIKIATKKSISKGFENRIHFLNGSSRSIQSNEKFDVIYTSMSFHHWKERENSISNIMAHLTSEGSFNIYEIKPHKVIYWQIANSHTMRASDFEDIGEKMNLAYDIKENRDFIRCSLKQKET
ncbi:MAG: class I SAM-dependent methyltransferase [Cuniculiplasma sp.]